eukprot:scaffold8179_cov430-Prasinococcus_capsulatus_cf.AAC.14
MPKGAGRGTREGLLLRLERARVLEGAAAQVRGELRDAARHTPSGSWGLELAASPRGCTWPCGTQDCHKLATSSAGSHDHGRTGGVQGPPQTRPERFPLGPCSLDGRSPGCLVPLQGGTHLCWPRLFVRSRRGRACSP